VKDLETKLSKRETVEVPDTPTAGNEQEEGASTSKSDTLYDIVRAMSSDDNDDDAKQASNKRKIESIDAETTHKKKTKKVKNKKSSVTDLVRKNQMAYAKFITKKVPKLLRALGVSSHSGSSDEN
jgi:phosphoenolpyruvate carboxylase